LVFFPLDTPKHGFSVCRPITMDWFTVHSPTATVVALAAACGLTPANVSNVAGLSAVRR
jgi:hypothetical protein